jgi:hypothetical protein
MHHPAITNTSTSGPAIDSNSTATTTAHNEVLDIAAIRDDEISTSEEGVDFVTTGIGDCSTVA